MDVKELLGELPTVAAPGARPPAPGPAPLAPRPTRLAGDPSLRRRRRRDARAVYPALLPSGPWVAGSRRTAPDPPGAAGPRIRAKVPRSHFAKRALVLLYSPCPIRGSDIGVS